MSTMTMSSTNMKQGYLTLGYLPTTSKFVTQSKYFNCRKQLRLRTAYNPSLPNRRKNGAGEGKNGITKELGSQLCLEVFASFILANILTGQIGTQRNWRALCKSSTTPETQTYFFYVKVISDYLFHRFHCWLHHQSVNNK